MARQVVGHSPFGVFNNILRVFGKLLSRLNNVELTGSPIRAMDARDIGL